MRLDRSVLLLVASFAALGCAHATVDPARRAAMDQKIAAMKTASAVHQGRQFARPGDDTTPPALAPGQWITIEGVGTDGASELTTYAITGVVGDAYWYEIIQDDYDGHFELRLLV